MGSICKLAAKTIGRFGKATLVMLFLGFLFLLTTSHAYTVLHQELAQSYTLPGSVTGQIDLARYLEIEAVEAATPVLTFDTTLTAGKAALSATVTAVTAEYLHLPFTQGSGFPEQSNMPFLVLNQYAAEHFFTEDKQKQTVGISEEVTMTFQEQTQRAIVCGIFDDDSEQPMVYMSYTLAARHIPRGEQTQLLFRLESTEALEAVAKAIRRLGANVSYDEALPERWRLTRQQVYQTFLSALALLLCAAVQMRKQQSQERTQNLPERQALALSGLNPNHLRWLHPLRTAFADLACLLLAATVTTLLGMLSWPALCLAGIFLVVHVAFGVQNAKHMYQISGV